MTDTETNIVLFGPTTGKYLKREYPELARNKVFDSLNSDELLFAWYMGNKSSPIDESWNESVRAKQAAWQCFTKGNENRTKYASLDIPVKVKEAIEEMRKYSPDARMMAKKMTQEMFNNLQKMVRIEDEDFKKIDKESKEVTIDYAAKRQYVEICAKVSETIPVLLKQLEEGYGITESQKKGEESTVKAIDKFHQNKKDKS